VPVGTTLEDSERLVALKTFAFTGGDHGKTARILGIEEETLRMRLQHWLGQPEPVV
jgi:DNA-binding NtrC family response regulator